MNPFYDAFLVTGLSNTEASEYLAFDGRPVNPVTIGRWKSGKLDAPVGVIEQLQELAEAIKLVAEGHDIELPYDSSYKMAEVRKLLLTEAMNKRNT